MKFCRDCQHFEPILSHCRKQPVPLNPVHGTPLPDWRSVAAQQRSFGFLHSLWANACGKRGRWFRLVNQIPQGLSHDGGMPFPHQSGPVSIRDVEWT